MVIPRLVIAGIKSGVGKTSIATGLMAALARKGLRVQGFKVGPDYIDPGFHTVATGRVSRNLDTFLVPPEGILELFLRASQGCDLAIVEGVMGLYDGRLEDGASSTAEVSKLLKAPVLLVVDVASMGQSAAALVLGFCKLDPEINIAGVILNRVSSPRHLELVRGPIEKATGIPVVGWIGKGALPPLPSRHLGLVPALEQENIKRDIERLGLALEASLNLEEILKIARRAGPLPQPAKERFPSKPPVNKVSIALAWDKAFNFYYQDGLDYLSALGVEWVPFSPLKEEKLPEGIAGLVIGGGFPEVFLPELSSNKRMLRLVARAAAQGLPLYAECGGLMYLSRGLKDHNGRYWPLAGVIPALCHMGKRLAGMGYRQARALRPTLYTRPGEVVSGHEFHYSHLKPLQTFFPWAYSWPGTASSIFDGYAFNNILASYLHLHWVGNTKLAQRFVEACRRYQKRKLVGKERG